MESTLLGRWIMRLWRKIRPPKEPDVPDPAPGPNPQPPQTQPPNPATPDRYRAGFIWKPESEGDGRLVVLLPSAFTTHTGRRMELVSDGHVVESSTRAHNTLPMPNGNREHYRFRLVGGNYPNGLECVVGVGSTRWAWRIPNTGSRYDGNVTPTARS